jgi:hypothetical protein
MSYIVIAQSETRTSSERADYINGLLYEIVKHPTSTGTAQLFAKVEHPETGQAALQIDLEQVMPLQNAEPLAALVDELSDTVGIAEAAQWAASMVGSTVTFGDLLPEGAVVYGHEAMEADGWFETNEIEG